MASLTSTPVRALVVENDLTSRELLARVLRLRGAEVETAVGAAQAAGLLVAGAAYDLLVIDLNLEPVHGVELLRQVAVFPAGRRPGRIIVISDSFANSHPRLSELGLEMELFQKPVPVARLTNVVENLQVPARL